MTKQDMNKLLALMKANYSYAFKNMSQQEKYLLLETWTFTLQDLDVHIVFLAIMQLISISKWLPTVAEIREQCQQLYYEAGNAKDNLRLREQMATYLGTEGNIAPEAWDVYDTIQSTTCHLRGDTKPMLTLEAMMQHNQYSLTDGGIGRMLSAPEESARILDDGGGRDYEGGAFQACSGGGTRGKR